MRACACVSMYEHIKSMRVSSVVCMNLCMYACTYIYVYAHKCVYTHTYTQMHRTVQPLYVVEENDHWIFLFEIRLL